MTERRKVTDQTACGHVGARPLRWSAVVVSRGLRASAMDSTCHTRSTHAVPAAACAILGASLLAVGAVLMKPVESSGISPRIDGANGSIDPHQESNMKTLHAFRTAGALGVLAVTQIALVSGASAQSTAVQWRVEDGGNGHWYVTVVTGGEISWSEARTVAQAKGADLAKISSTSCMQFAFLLTVNTPGAWIPFGNSWLGPWLGGKQLPDATEPAGGWAWTDGTMVDFASLRVDFNNSSGCGVNEDCLSFWKASSPPISTDTVDFVVSDFPDRGYCEPQYPHEGSYVIEWSADCNNDNIVDYGQIITGQLADSNTNGIPDICEQPQCLDADITNNHIVDGADLGSLLAFWGPVNPVLPQADINRDGVVNGADIGILLANWGPCGT